MQEAKELANDPSTDYSAAPLEGQQAVGVGSIEYPSAERRRLAALSREWVCPHCNESNLKLLPELPIEASGSTVREKIVEPLSVPSESEKAESAAEAERSEPVAEPEPIMTPERVVFHNIGTLLPSGDAQSRPGPFIARTAVETQTTIRATRKPPLVLVDGAICMLFAVALAMICRRMA
ncbi:hypothetical protein C0992_010694 [Termitomyces sp. T32_za158]|nr:hypothetical protein C0992_010694 [Termitomyces sp. T32_za158]